MNFFPIRHLHARLDHSGRFILGQAHTEQFSALLSRARCLKSLSLSFCHHLKDEHVAALIDAIPNKDAVKRLAYVPHSDSGSISLTSSLSSSSSSAVVVVVIIFIVIVSLHSSAHKSHHYILYFFF